MERVPLRRTPSNAPDRCRSRHLECRRRGAERPRHHRAGAGCVPGRPQPRERGERPRARAGSPWTRVRGGLLRGLVWQARRCVRRDVQPRGVGQLLRQQDHHLRRGRRRTDQRQRGVRLPRLPPRPGPDGRALPACVRRLQLPHDQRAGGAPAGPARAVTGDTGAKGTGVRALPTDAARA